MTSSPPRWRQERSHTPRDDRDAAVSPPRHCDRTSYADPPPSKQFEHDMMARFHMHESYTLFGAIEHLLVRGKLDEARDLARSIGVAPDEVGLSAFAAQATAVRDRARARTRTDPSTDRANTYGELLVTCASCHVISTH